MYAFRKVHLLVCRVFLFVVVSLVLIEEWPCSRLSNSQNLKLSAIKRELTVYTAYSNSQSGSTSQESAEWINTTLFMIFNL